MVHFDRKNCQSQTKNLSNKTEFCANCASGLINFARKSFALSGIALSVPPVYIIIQSRGFNATEAHFIA